jgi:hypothetical protein
MGIGGRVALSTEADDDLVDPYPYCERPIILESLSDCRGHCNLSGSSGHSAGLLEDCGLIYFPHLGVVLHIMSLVIFSVTQMDTGCQAGCLLCWAQ